MEVIDNSNFFLWTLCFLNLFFLVFGVGLYNREGVLQCFVGWNMGLLMYFTLMFFAPDVYTSEWDVMLPGVTICAVFAIFVLRAPSDIVVIVMVVYLSGIVWHHTSDSITLWLRLHLSPSTPEWAGRLMFAVIICSFIAIMWYLQVVRNVKRLTLYVLIAMVAVIGERIFFIEGPVDFTNKSLECGSRIEELSWKCPWYVQWYDFLYFGGVLAYELGMSWLVGTGRITWWLLCCNRKAVRKRREKLRKRQEALAIKAEQVREIVRLHLSDYVPVADDLEEEITIQTQNELG
jgi:hypothetical protein